MAIEHYYDEDGNALILYSPEYGAGWSTWDDPWDVDSELRYAIARDKRVVEYYIKNNPTEQEMKNFLETLGYMGVFMGGYDLEIARIPKGHQFRIDEYDGAEQVIDLNDMNYPIA